MIKTLKVRDKIFPVNIAYAPLAGYSSSAFRLIAWRYGRPAFTVTEMISVNALLQKKSGSLNRYLAKDREEGPVSFQLFGSDPLKMGEATKIVTDSGADMIDLNCGCPVKKVRRQNAGSKLLTDLVTLEKLILAIKNNTHLPVSIKIRVEGSSSEKFHDDILKIICNSGIDFLVVHGRSWREGYTNICHYDQIKFFVEALKIPVIGNGNICDKDSLAKMLATGCSGAMIGRASLGQPWLIPKLIASFGGEAFNEPSLQEKIRIFLEHVALLIGSLGSEKFALINARKLVPNYLRGCDERKEIFLSLNMCKSFAELERIVSKF